jgi:hypothetical protein
MVVVILGILAAAVIIYLSHITEDSAQAACNSDAKNIEEAVESFHDNPSNTAAADQYPTSPNQLTDPASAHFGGPYLRTRPTSSRYLITLDSTNPGQVDINDRNYDGSPNPCSNIY